MPWASPHTSRLMAMLLIVLGITYSSWVLEFVLHTGLDPAVSFLSELDGVGRPYAAVFSIADTVTGVLAIIAAGLGLVRRPPWLLKVAWWALATFGASTVADSRLPMTCVSTRTHLCGAHSSNLFPQLHSVHALTSTIAVTAWFVLMVAATAAAVQGRRLPILRGSGLVAAITASVSTAWLLIADNLPGDYTLGIAQRVQIGAMSLWLVALGVGVAVTPEDLSAARSGRQSVAGSAGAANHPARR